jgi:tRNA nucleotidyltransferase (CCA-adding enzyme)
LRPATLLDLLLAADALRRPERLDDLIAACECDALSRPGAGDVYAPGVHLERALEVVKAVDAGAVARRAGSDKPSAGNAAANAIAAAIRAARLSALRGWRRDEAMNAGRQTR